MAIPMYSSLGVTIENRHTTSPIRVSVSHAATRFARSRRLREKQETSNGILTWFSKMRQWYLQRASEWLIRIPAEFAIGAPRLRRQWLRESRASSSARHSPRTKRENQIGIVLILSRQPIVRDLPTA